MDIIKLFCYNFLYLLQFLALYQSKNIIELNSDWEFQSEKDERMLPAKVPGTVHLDLLENGIIEDPFFRLNEHELQWIDKLDWNYRTNFNINDFHYDFDSIELHFHGLDTYADVFLNDSMIYSADNMFIGKTVDIKKNIIKGNNELLVKFKSPIKVGIEKYDKLGYNLPENANDLSEIGKVAENKKVGVFSRKAPYSFGWDWGPRLVTSGIWRPVNLNFWNNFKIKDLHITQNIIDNDAFLKAEVELLSVIENQNVITKIYVDNKLIKNDLVFLN